VSVLFAFISSVTADAGQQVVMKIQGMTCQLCSLAVKKALSAVEGVNDVKVSYDKAEARMKVSNTVKDQVLVDAVARAGPYKGRVIKRNPIE
jgi:mercuric ion binding protein